MTIGTATVASTKGRGTVGSVCSQPPSARFSTARVGKTASQIISASWCVLGGATRTGGPAGRVVIAVLLRRLLISGYGRRGAVARTGAPRGPAGRAGGTGRRRR